MADKAFERLSKIATNIAAILGSFESKRPEFADMAGRFSELEQSHGLMVVKDTIVYGVAMTPDMALGSIKEITVNNGVGFALNAPINPYEDQWLELTIRNTSGGAMGAIAWNAIFKMAAFAAPANTFSKAITFRWDGTNWVEKSRTPVDVPN